MSKESQLLRTETQLEIQHKLDLDRQRKRRIIYIAVAVVLTAVVAVLLTFLINPYQNPREIRMASYSPLQLRLGQSRVLQVLYSTDRDNRTVSGFKTATNRDVVWNATPDGVVTVDKYGRVTTVGLGQATIKVTARNKPRVNSQLKVVVSQQVPIQPSIRRRVVNYTLKPAPQKLLLQRIVTKSQGRQIALQNISNNKTAKAQGSVQWQIRNYANGTNYQYVVRTDSQAQNRDQTLYFVGERYLPGAGFIVSSLQDATDLSVVIKDDKGGISKIQLVNMTAEQKSELITQQTRQKVMRHGLASDSYFDGQKYVPAVSDNDGLWTSMYTVGELMKYAYYRQAGQLEKAAAARKSALYSLKAVLLLTYISGRNKTVQARIRHYNNTRSGDGQFLSSKFLRADKPYAVDNYYGSPADGVGFFGLDSGQTVEGDTFGGQFKYSLGPLVAGDWTDDPEQAATTKRNLSGFVARTFVIQPLEGIPNDGLFFKRNANGTQTVAHEADKLYDYGKNDHPQLQLGDLPIPDQLLQVLNVSGTQYDRHDLAYKGDTSTDQIIGHLFVYKVAFDVLSQSDAEEQGLRTLITRSMCRYCENLANNGYTMVDATGQGTTWAKLTRDFLNSDFTLEDAPIKALELLMSFKLCEYVTGDSRWNREYRFLIEDKSFRYLDLVASLWDRFVYRSYNQENKKAKWLRLNPQSRYSQEQIVRHVMYDIHYSDQEQAMLGFYLAFQLQDDPVYLAKYRKAIDCWWHSISRSENPLWYYIYQLAYNTTQKTDHYNQSLIDVAAYQLARHPVSGGKAAAFVQGARPDVLLQGFKQVLSVNPFKVIGQRNHISDSQLANRPMNSLVFKDYDPKKLYEIKVLPSDERAIHKFNGATFEGVQHGQANGVEACTVYTLPLWLGVYHGMLKLS